MKNLGVVKKILGMKIVRDRSKIMLWMSQEVYIKTVFEMFNMQNTPFVHVPMTKKNKKWVSFPLLQLWIVLCMAWFARDHNRLCCRGFE
jgi:hypothetical protein